jgi:hypothetical protein
MVYSQPQNQTFDTLEISANRSVEVIYNGSGLHKIAGPVPFVDISQSVLRNGAGAVEGHVTRIDITGKIVKNGVDPHVVPAGSGIGPVMSGIIGLRDLFSKSNLGHLKINCGVTNTIFEASGVKVLDMSFNKSDDNWLFTADYSINLEYYQPSGLSAGYYVQSTNDSWSIEPLEEATYVSFSQTVSQKGETNNPKLKPTAPTSTSPVPGGYGGGGSVGTNALNVVNFPQYRISHRVSAVGIPSGTGVGISNTAWLEAKKWVEFRLSTAFYQSSVSSGLAYFLNSSNPTVSTFSSENIFLYNHLRSTNFSVSEGSYEINDTWLAMPSGIPYVEDYSIDASTDDKFMKTVRVQGQIRGLNITPFAVMSGNSSYTIPDSGGKINLSGGMQLLSSTSMTHPVLDLTPSTNSAVANVYPNKYENALSGWIYDIKPYAYRRASLAMRSVDRANNTYTNPANTSTPPNNPFYCEENLLNPNPISTTEGHDPRKGTISYSVEYTNKLNLISGVLSENIGINDTGPADVFGESFIIGRRLGPILQSLNAKTSARKDVSIDITVVPPSSAANLSMTSTGCPMYTGGSIYSSINTLIEALRPFGARTSEYFGNTGARGVQNGQVFVSQDNQTWNPSEGRYSRNVSWVYQQCNNSKNYLDH